MLPGCQAADELKAVIALGLEQPPDMTADRADALALGGQQGLELVLPEGALQGQAAEHRLLAQAKGQIVLEGGGVVAVVLEQRIVVLQLLQPRPALGLGELA